MNTHFRYRVHPDHPEDTVNIRGLDITKKWYLTGDARLPAEFEDAIRAGILEAQAVETDEIYRGDEDWTEAKPLLDYIFGAGSPETQAIVPPSAPPAEQEPDPTGDPDETPPGDQGGDQDPPADEVTKDAEPGAEPTEGSDQPPADEQPEGTGDAEPATEGTSETPAETEETTPSTGDAETPVTNADPETPAP